MCKDSQLVTLYLCPFLAIDGTLCLLTASRSPKTERGNTAIFVVMAKLQSNHVKAIQHKVQHLGGCLAGLALGRGLCRKGVEEGAGLQARRGRLARSRSRLRKRRKGFLPARRTCSVVTFSEEGIFGTGLKK